ncbi:TetR/AcrR family transcriptional regulator [Xinfangfangia sp. D13-10-4-6]|uniref:TetR/AcrR family transcriptional regulator n=1 Tax=Pseudogemmobacter hezensis TaxID=2737662 RepID=UPI00155806FC|nr:TetR/AcrR family transcriptional regulator [Pseudogemmobacter hezensis]NPD16672.1 TetR/AcrR family transcriptional regulator [Pseudogemmobacter hezensis]
MARKRVPEQHEGRMQEILEAAHRCFMRHGLQGASISMICKEAGMSPGHLYHYFPSKEAIVEQMADDYLSRLHAHFGGHKDSEATATVLLSELWSMTGWDDLAHCRILFELLAEAGRNEKIHAILKANTDGVRQLLAETLKAGQARGEVDPDLDPEHTSAVLVAILDAAPMLPLMTSGIGFEESRKLITTMVSRFLQPQG